MSKKSRLSRLSKYLVALSNTLRKITTDVADAEYPFGYEPNFINKLGSGIDIVVNNDITGGCFGWIESIKIDGEPFTQAELKTTTITEPLFWGLTREVKYPYVVFNDSQRKSCYTHLRVSEKYWLEEIDGEFTVIDHPTNSLINAIRLKVCQIAFGKIHDQLRESFSVMELDNINFDTNFYQVHPFIKATYKIRSVPVKYRNMIDYQNDTLTILVNEIDSVEQCFDRIKEWIKTMQFTVPNVLEAQYKDFKEEKIGSIVTLICGDNVFDKIEVSRGSEPVLRGNFLFYICPYTNTEIYRNVSGVSQIIVDVRQDNGDVVKKVLLG